MDNQDLQKFIGGPGISLIEAMRKIDVNASRVLFLEDESGSLSGCVSDGDVRRYLLAGGKIEDPAVRAANSHPRAAYSPEEAKQLFDKINFTAIPILDADGRILDIYTGKKNAAEQRASLNVPVVINAGGRGTRLDPFTKVLPKPLIPVGELPIIEHIMREYQSYDCNKFHIIVNYKRELMKAYFASDSEKSFDISWYDEEKPLGTGGGLCLLKGKLDSTFFFTNCDNLLTANYERILQFHRKNRNLVTMVCAYKNLSVPYGVVEMGVNGKIEGMREKPLLTFLTNTGIYVVEPEVLDEIEDNVSIGFPDVVNKLREQGKNVAVFPVSEMDWMDMGQLSELDKMRERLYGD